MLDGWLDRLAHQSAQRHRNAFSGNRTARGEMHECREQHNRFREGARHPISVRVFCRSAVTRLALV
jgi:hypothetical protein